MPRDAKFHSGMGETKSPQSSPLREAIVAILLVLAVVGPLWAMDWLTERRQEIEQMTPAEKEELNKEYEKFLALPPKEQEQLRVLHQKLDTDPQGDRLRRVMHQYYDWLKTLSPNERADLADLLSKPPSDRLAMIKKIKQHQEALAVKLSDGSHLTVADVQNLTEWVKKYAAVHEAELAKEMPPPRHAHQGAPPIMPRDGELPKDMPPPRHGEFHGNENGPHERAGQFSAWRPWLAAKLPNVSKEEIDDLARQLSPEPRKAIEARPTLADKTQIIHEWVQAIWRQRFNGGGFARQGRNVNSKDLAHFFAHDLSKEQQDELSHMAGEEQRRELRRLYFQHHHRSGESPSDAGGSTDQHTNKTAPKPLTPSPPPSSTPAPSTPPPAEKQPPAIAKPAAATK